MRRKTYSKLDVKIRYEKLHRAYRIIVDGDVFWADTYEHAIIRLFYILSRDEFLVRDCKCTNKVDAFDIGDQILDSMSLSPLPNCAEILPVCSELVSNGDDNEIPF